MWKASVRFLTGLLAVACAISARADAPADPRAVIDKAIKALGGAENLAKLKAETRTDKGTYYGMGAGFPYTGKYAIQYPDKFRMDIENVFLIVVNGDQGWIAANGGTENLTKDQLAEHKDQLYAGWVATLLPLKDKAFTLAALGEVKVADRPAVGVKVSHQGQRDIRLFFDKETGLLVKREYQVKAEDQGGKEVNQEVLLSDYQEAAGLKFPRKVVVNRDGKLYVEAEVSDWKPAEKLDDKLFAKP
jgi:outer membrane lipoprotein-sorting protein